MMLRHTYAVYRSPAVIYVTGVKGRLRAMAFRPRVNAPKRLSIAGRVARAGVDSRFRSACGAGRSEEHTSELQSLMRISYAVFCLKKKKLINQTRPPQ